MSRFGTYWVYSMGPIYKFITGLTDRTVVDYNGILLDLGFPCIHPAIYYRFHRGLLSYEEPEREMLAQHLDSNTNLIELGGGIGYISCYSNELLEDSTIHVTIEPNPDLIPVLKRNRDLNNCDFVIKESGYNSQNDNFRLNISRNFYSSSIFNTYKKVNTIDVQGCDLNHLVTKFNIDNFALLCDIEGAEQDILLNECSLLDQKCEQIIIEIHNHYNETAIKEFCNKTNFNIIDKDSSGEVYVLKCE